MDDVVVDVTVNGARRKGLVEPRLTLADYLRDNCGLTGTHLACEHGVCGACTVMVDGNAVRSCLMLAVQVDGHDVTTVEGLADADGTLSPVQQAFMDCHGLQCGFCTPGFVMTLAALTQDGARPSEEELVGALSGNLCRCTGYQGIKRACRRLAGSNRTDAGEHA